MGTIIGNPTPGPWPETLPPPQEGKARKLECGCVDCWAESQARMALDAAEAELGKAGIKAHSGPNGRLTLLRKRWAAAVDAAGQAHGLSPMAFDEA
jgi:hypothetical protein